MGKAAAIDLSSVSGKSICKKAQELALNAGSNSYYLLGVRKGDIQTLNHEIAHGLFYTNQDYQQLMTNSVNSIDKDLIQPLFDNLIEMGYGENVLVDEAQAYLGTGLRDSQKKMKVKKLAPIFRKNFNKFMKNWKMPTPLEKNILIS